MVWKNRRQQTLDNEKKVISGLKILGQATKYEISEEINMPYSTINDALERLALRGRAKKELIKENKIRGRKKAKWKLIK